MINKTDKHQYYFEVELKRSRGREGLLRSKSIEEPLVVATPPEFAGGIEGTWSPETLFLGSLCSCLMATYLAFAEKRKLAVSDFKCTAIGQIQLVEGHLEFTTIDLFPTVQVENEADIPLGNDILTKTYKHCIIANSVRSHLVHHGVVIATA